MAWKYYYWRCPQCGGTFPDLAQSPNEPPDRCKLCHAWMAFDEPPSKVFVPTAPRIRKSAKVKAADQTYRMMEQTSAERAEAAVAQLEDAYASGARDDPHEGNPAMLAEMQRHQLASMKSTLKVTDMKDPSEMREGDTAYIAPRGEVKQIPGLPAANFGGGLPSVPGYTPGTGATRELSSVMSGIRQNHANTALQVVATGNIARSK